MWKLDRLGRSFLGIVETKQVFAARSIRLVSLAKGLELGSPMGRMVLRVMGAPAEYELELIRERTMAGLAEATRDGKAHASAVAITEEHAELAAQMLSEGRHVEGKKLPAVQALDRPEVSRSALYACV